MRPRSLRLAVVLLCFEPAVTLAISLLRYPNDARNAVIHSYISDAVEILKSLSPTNGAAEDAYECVSNLLAMYDIPERFSSSSKGASSQQHYQQQEHHQVPTPTSPADTVPLSHQPLPEWSFANAPYQQDATLAPQADVQYFNVGAPWDMASVGGSGWGASASTSTSSACVAPQDLNLWPTAMSLLEGTGDFEQWLNELIQTMPN